MVRCEGEGKDKDGWCGLRGEGDEGLSMGGGAVGWGELHVFTLPRRHWCWSSYL